MRVRMVGLFGGRCARRCVELAGADLEAPHHRALLSLFVAGVARLAELVGGLGILIDELKLAEDVDDGPQPSSLDGCKVEGWARQAHRQGHHEVNSARTLPP